MHMAHHADVQFVQSLGTGRWKSVACKALLGELKDEVTKEEAMAEVRNSVGRGCIEVIQSGQSFKYVYFGMILIANDLQQHDLT